MSSKYDEYPDPFADGPMSSSTEYLDVDEYPDGFHTFNSPTLVAAYKRSEPVPSTEIVDEYAAKYHEKCARDSLLGHVCLRVGLEELVAELVKTPGVGSPSRDDIVEALAADPSCRWWEAIEGWIHGPEFDEQAKVIIQRALRQ